MEPIFVLGGGVVIAIVILLVLLMAKPSQTQPMTPLQAIASVKAAALRQKDKVYQSGAIYPPGGPQTISQWQYTTQHPFSSAGTPAALMR